MTPRPGAICNQWTVLKGKINAVSVTWCEALRHSSSCSRLNRTLSPSKPVRALSVARCRGPAPWLDAVSQLCDWMRYPSSVARFHVPACDWVPCSSSVAAFYVQAHGWMLCPSSMIGCCRNLFSLGQQTSTPTGGGLASGFSSSEHSCSVVR